MYKKPGIAMSVSSIALKICIFLSMVIGVAYTIRSEDFMGKGKSLMFFTVQSNIWIGSMCLVFAVLIIIGQRTHKDLLKNGFYILKFMFTVAITLTFLVMIFLLTPEIIAKGDVNYLATPSNIFCHYITPVLAVIDFLLFDTAWQSKWIDSLFAALMPLYYLVFTFICSYNGVAFSGGQKVPYFFLDYEKLTWFQITAAGPGVFWWIIILTILVIGMGFGFIALNKLMKKTRFAKKAGARLTKS